MESTQHKAAAPCKDQTTVSEAKKQNGNYFNMLSSGSSSREIKILSAQVPIYAFIRKYSKDIKLAFISSEKVQTFSDSHNEHSTKKRLVHSQDLATVLEENNISLVKWKVFYYDECEQAFVHLKADSLVPISYSKPLEIGEVVTKKVDHAIYVTLENNRMPTGNYHQIKTKVENCLQTQENNASNPDSGWFSIGIYRGKVEANHGTLWRSSYQFGAAFVFSIGARYKSRIEKRTDTFNTYAKVPFLQFKDSEQFLNSVPYSAAWVAVEMGGQPLESFIHPNRCVYILGSEDHGLPKDILTRCRFRVTLPSVNSSNFNVSAAGSILMYDRYLKRNTPQCVIDSTQSIDYKQNGNPRNKRKIWRQQ
uniref:tRNA/rRNA methyltransferase SpoU type domain-containing protein n=1 Tax=Aplanochytrium stocchinoi TaxID=215587 RepID=A0A7S3PKA4_9STRA|mmetsp:Transcript_6620/g.8652  ORF Transcript_6620/g.8652 Transcript_6620/m.8652 type:complete len:364 (+) Transcript_6620:154-1245(+)